MSAKPILPILVFAFSLARILPTFGEEAATAVPYSRSEDVVYGRRDGTALTMDVFRPEHANGLGIIQVICGGYLSSHADIHPRSFQELLNRGYTVFAVVPGSQPRYQVPEIQQNLARSVRYIRHHAQRFAIDPDRIGVTGGSAGGNLSLLIATAGDAGDPNSRDPIDRESSRVQAAAVFYPLTDFLNWSKPGEEHVGINGHPTPFKAAFDYREPIAEKGTWERITDPERLRGITRTISPIYSVSPEDPPMLLLHGDADFFVPKYQSEIFLKALQEAGITSELIVKPGGGHGWPGMEQDVVHFADWFDRHLKR